MKILLHDRLAAALDATDKRSPIILTTATGRPFTGSNFRHHFGKAVKKAGLGDQGLSFHGLRYAAASKVPILGLGTKHIGAFTGHKSLSMIQKYSAAADQEALADQVIIAWMEHDRNAKLENRDKGSGKPESKMLRNNAN